MPALFGDVNDSDLAKATATLAHFSRRTTDLALAIAGFNSIAQAALDDDRLGEVAIALCTAVNEVRPQWFTQRWADNWDELATQPVPPHQFPPTGDTLVEFDRNLAASLIHGYVVRDLRLVNHALATSDQHQRAGHLLLALCEAFSELEPHLFEPEAAEDWANLAAQLTTRCGASG